MVAEVYEPGDKVGRKGHLFRRKDQPYGLAYATLTMCPTFDGEPGDVAQPISDWRNGSIMEYIAHQDLMLVDE